MAVLPKNLSMVVQRLANFNRQTIRVRPMSNDQAEPGQTVVFRFPSNTIIDLHNLMIKANIHSTWKGKCAAKSGGAITDVWGELNMPKYSQAMFERVDVTVGGTTISGSNTDYGGIYTILRDALSSAVKKRPGGELDNSIEDIETLTNKLHLFSDSTYTASNTGKCYSNTALGDDSFKSSAGGNPYDGANFYTGAPKAVDVASNALVQFDGCEFYKEDSLSPNGQWKKEPVVYEGFLGFLGGKFVRFIDTSITGAIEIRLRLAPVSVTWGPQAIYKGKKKLLQGEIDSDITEATGNYVMKDLYMILDTISFTDDFYRQLLARRLIEGGSIVIPYDNYFSTSKMVGETGDTVTFNVATQSLDYLVGTLRRADYNSNPTSIGRCEAELSDRLFSITNSTMDAASAAPDKTATFTVSAIDLKPITGSTMKTVDVRSPSFNSSYYTFVSGASNTMTGGATYQWLVANQLVPSWPADVNDVWLLNQSALDLTNQISDVGLSQDHYEFRRGRFAHIVSFAHHAETEKFISGLDTRGASSNMQWMVHSLPQTTDWRNSAKTLSYNATVWACCTSTIEISAGQNITVIF